VVFLVCAAQLAAMVVELAVRMADITDTKLRAGFQYSVNSAFTLRGGLFGFFSPLHSQAGKRRTEPQTVENTSQTKTK
jgi:hypothetical protein